MSGLPGAVLPQPMDVGYDQVQGWTRSTLQRLVALFKVDQQIVNGHQTGYFTALNHLLILVGNNPPVGLQ